MTHRTAGRVARPRVCARCKGPISESRPVFLVYDNGGRIVGPYHAGCAARVKMDAAANNPWAKITPEVFGQIVPKPDQEAEPW